MSLADYQTQEAKYQLLYEDRRKIFDERAHVGGVITDDVSVKLVVWSTDWSEMFVILSRVVVDCKEEITSAKVLNGTTVPGAIKEAMNQFEQLIEAHPGL